MAPRVWAGQARGGGWGSKKYAANAIVLFLEFHTQVYLLCLVAQWGFLFALPLPHPRPSLSPPWAERLAISLFLSVGWDSIPLFCFPATNKKTNKVGVMKSRSNRLYLTWCAFAWVANAIGSTRNQSILDMTRCLDVK